MPKISGVVRKLNAEKRSVALCPSCDLVDVLRIDLGFHRQPVAVRHDHHDRLAGRNDAADRVHGRLEDRAVLRRADVGALELVERRDLAFDEFSDARIDFAHFLCNFAREILVDLDDLQLQLGDFSLGLRGRGDQLPALAAEPRCLALELAQPRYRDEIFLIELAHAGEFVLDEGDFLVLRRFLRAEADDLFVGLVDALAQLRFLPGARRAAQIEQLHLGRHDLRNVWHIGLLHQLFGKLDAAQSRRARPTGVPCGR